MMKHEGRVTAVCVMGLLLTVSTSLSRWRMLPRPWLHDDMDTRPHGWKEELSLFLGQQLWWGLTTSVYLLLFFTGLVAVGAPYGLRMIQDAQMAARRREKAQEYDQHMRRAREEMQQRLAEQSKALQCCFPQRIDSFIYSFRHLVCPDV